MVALILSALKTEEPLIAVKGNATAKARAPHTLTPHLFH